MTNLVCQSWRRQHRLQARAALFAGSIALCACGAAGLLDQEAPNRVLADELDNPGNAQLLVTSAIGDFECAFVGYVIGGGLVSDELRDAQNSLAAWDFDRRTMNPAGGSSYPSGPCGDSQAPGVYTPLSTARFSADDVARKLEGWSDQDVPGRQNLLAQAYAYAAYTLVLLGEGFCSMAVDGGPELTRAQAFDLATQRFTSAVAAASGAQNGSIRFMALVGRARAALGRGDRATAMADAQQVTDPSFVLNATYSGATARRENSIWVSLFRGGFATIDDPFRSVTVPGPVGSIPDPRVPVAKRTAAAGDVRGHDGVTLIFATAKYPAISSPIAIAKWAEAQLIVAEVQGGQVAVDLINGLRHRAGLSAASDVSGGTAAAIQAQVVEERRRELFLDGHRLGDMIRSQLPLYPPAGRPFTPETAKGGVYGSQVCFPLPDVERLNNPNFSQ